MQILLYGSGWNFCCVRIGGDVSVQVWGEIVLFNIGWNLYFERVGGTCSVSEWVKFAVGRVAIFCNVHFDLPRQRLEV